MTFLYIVIYVAGVFAAREMNWRLYFLADKKHKVSPLWVLWFFSWLAFLAITITGYLENIFKRPKLPVFQQNWFTGKYWLRKEETICNRGVMADYSDAPRTEYIPAGGRAHSKVFLADFSDNDLVCFDDTILNTRLDILKFLLKRLHEQNSSERFTGLCYVLRHMQLDGLITTMQEDDTYYWLKAKYNADNKKSFWWPRGILQLRINAIEDCIAHEEKLLK